MPISGGGGGEATKEIFVPAFVGTELYFDSSWAGESGYRMDAGGDVAHLRFYVPADFSSIINAVVVIKPNSSGTHRLNIRTTYGAAGQTYLTHNESSVDQDLSLTDDQVYEWDISGVLTALAAGDYVHIRLWGDATNTANVIICGVRLKYA